MSKYDTYDLAETVAIKLKSAGYTFHRSDNSAEDDVEHDDDDEVQHWFCWSDGLHEMQLGPKQDNELAALADAFDHYFDMTVRFTRP
jgi:hypothetical protein